MISRPNQGRAIAFNLSAEDIRERVVAPWERGEPLVLQGQQFDPTHSRVHIVEGPEAPDDHSSITRWTNLVVVSTDVTDRFLSRPVGSRSRGHARAGGQHAVDRRTVMVIHGRDLNAAHAIFDFLRALDLKPLEWSQLVSLTGEGSPYIGDVLERAFDIAQAAVVLFSPDDEARLAEHLWTDDTPGKDKAYVGQARPNVFFEAGMAFGRFPERTVMVELGEQRQASDLTGRHVVRLDDSPERRNELAQRLAQAGCPVNTQGQH